MEYDIENKIVLKNDITIGQKLNVTAFLMSGITGMRGVAGAPYLIKDGGRDRLTSQWPIGIHTATWKLFGERLQKVLAKQVALAIDTKERFGACSDEDGRAMVADFKTKEPNFAGTGIREKENPGDKLLKGFAFHG